MEDKRIDNEENKVGQKYTKQYMSLGMCLGMSMGLLLGTILYPDNIALGMCLGMPMGMLWGIIIGSAKDKRLAQNIMKITKISAIGDSKKMLVVAVDKAGTEKQYTLDKSRVAEQKFEIGARVAEEKEGYIVSID